jgi:Cys-rich protein (TIGR01571 family)|eukprot:3525870-Prymnesium_polylepis.1
MPQNAATDAYGELNDAAKEAAALTPTAQAIPVAAEMAIPARGMQIVAAQSTWSTGLFGCLQDCCSSTAAVACCPQITTGQLWERHRGPKRVCLKVAAALFALNALNLIIAVANEGPTLQAIEEASPIGDTSLYNPRYQAAVGGFSSLALVGDMISFLELVTFVFLIATVRSAVRERDGIREEQCFGCEDCCCALWCNACVTCQMLRHDGLRGDNYALCSPTGHATPTAV